MTVQTIKPIQKQYVFDKNLKEIKKHGTDEFPLMFYRGSLTEFKKYGTHWHEEMEVIYVTSGSINVQINHVNHILHLGDIAVIQKGFLHSIEKLPTIEETITFDTLIFHLNLLQGHMINCTQKNIISKLDDSSIELVRVIKRDNEHYQDFLNVFKQMHQAFDQKHPYYETLIKGLLMVLLYEILRCGYYEHTVHGNKTKTIITKAIDSIMKNLSSPIKITELANSVGYNESYFMRAFKDNTGSTVTEFINEKRVELAKVQLSSTSMKISEVAFQSGYTNLGYFNRVFKRLSGYTPREYRKRYFMSKRAYNQPIQ
jgi:AraC-like DNA-binding protein